MSHIYVETTCKSCGKPRRVRRYLANLTTCLPCAVVARKRPLEARFWECVNKNGPIPKHQPKLGRCWVWTTGCSAGYGAIEYEGKHQRAHVVGFFLQFGRWPTPCALHHCDNRKCVRGDHLFEGTQRDNILDMRAKGRGSNPPRLAREEHPGAKLTEKQVAEIRADADAVAGKYGAQARLARKFNVSRMVVGDVARGKTWKP